MSRLPSNARHLLLCIALLVLLFGTAVAQVQVPVSGYEIFLGHNCVIGGVAATCGATFTGWTGETAGAGWLAFPGTKQGTWSIQVNYTGKPMFSGSVTIVGGKWRFLFINGTELRGKVVSGTVTWPEANMPSSCGTDVAVVQAELSVVGGGTAAVAGCLHDLPAGSVIPPQVWGTFIF